MSSPVKATSGLVLRTALVCILGVAGSLAVEAPAGATALIRFDSSTADFGYTQATTVKCGWCGRTTTKTFVQVMPTGTVSFLVRNTPDVYVLAYGNDAAYSVSVDGGVAIARATSACACWEQDVVATSLSSASHQVLLTNTSPVGLDGSGLPTGGLDVQGWYVDQGGLLSQTVRTFPSSSTSITYSSVTFVNDPLAASGTLALVPAGATASFWIANTSLLQLMYLENGASFTTSQNDKVLQYQVKEPNSGVYRRVTSVDWGLQPGLTKVALTVTTGTLALDRLQLWQRGDVGDPSLVPSSAATQSPLLTAWGDSITAGQASLGPTSMSDGYADRVATAMGDRLSDVAYPAKGAVCWGQYHVADVVQTNPNLVVVAWGVNDALGAGPSCPRASPSDFSAAMDSIVSQLQQALPAVPIYLGAIILTPRLDDATRAQWNQAIQDVAATHGVGYVDPSSALTFETDYRDKLHPNNGGAAKIAAYWDSVLP
jgi:lysophospholipase L1-like esterase